MTQFLDNGVFDTMDGPWKFHSIAFTILILLLIVALATFLSGCATKTRSIDLAGMYASESGTLAIGRIEVQSAPEGVESAAIRYTEDTAWLSPTTKTHSLKILLTGTNAVNSAEGIVSSICGAFTAKSSCAALVATAPSPSCAESGGAQSPATAAPAAE